MPHGLQEREEKRLEREKTSNSRVWMGKENRFLGHEPEALDYPKWTGEVDSEN